MHLSKTTVLTTAAAALALVAATSLQPAATRAQTISLAPGSSSSPPASAGCAAFSPDGDLFDATGAIPLGPGPTCGLGWPVASPPGNLDAFSSGLTPAFFGLGLPLPLPAPPSPGLSLMFTVDEDATGAAPGCVPAAPYFAPNVGSEAAALPALVFAFYG